MYLEVREIFQVDEARSCDAAAAAIPGAMATCTMQRQLPQARHAGKSDKIFLCHILLSQVSKSVPYHQFMIALA